MGIFHVHGGRPSEAASALSGDRPGLRLLVAFFYRISADGLERLVTVRAEISPGLRLEEGLCFLKAIPFRDRDSLGRRRPLHGQQPFRRPCGNYDRLRSFVQPLNALCDISGGLKGIQRFELGDGIGLRLRPERARPWTAAPRTAAPTSAASTTLDSGSHHGSSHWLDERGRASAGTATNQ